MKKAVQQPGQARYGAVQGEEDVVITTPWRARADGKVAIMLSERTTVFVPPPSLPADDVATVLPVATYGDVPTEWTADLVLCRLQVVMGWANQLPPVRLPGALKSFLGAMQPQEAGPLRRPLSPHQSGLLDWTWEELQAFGEVDRAVLMGVACGFKLPKIVAITTHLHNMGIGLKRPVRSKSSVHRRYRSLLAGLARKWNAAGHAIDPAAIKAWGEQFKKAIK